MKKLSVLLNIFLLIGFSVTAQTEKKLNKVMELTITEEGGANGDSEVRQEQGEVASADLNQGRPNQPRHQNKGP